MSLLPWRGFCAALVLGLIALGVHAAPGWTAAWAAAPQNFDALPQLPGVPAAPKWMVQGTVRQQLTPALNGKQVRVRFSNRFGQRPLRIAAATVALGTGGGNLSPGTLQPLLMDGRAAFEVPPGQERWTDGAALAVQAGQSVMVSFALAEAVPATVVHRLPAGGAWAVAGDQTRAARLRDAQRPPWNLFVTGLDVKPPRPANVVVAFGDSITEGSGAESGSGAARYPQRLGVRLQDNDGRMPVAVINAGIGGNRLLADVAGPSGLSRFDADVLQQSGATHVVVLIGINDIGFGTFQGKVLPGFHPPSAQALTAGLQQLVDRARARGLKVLLGTLLPFEGSGYWSEANEAKREAVNRWIRGRQDVGVIDFDAALQDPAHPRRLAERYDSGDHLHPNAAGTAAMAQAADVPLLRE
ncbi:SGNH/GDSL hydrolase family protein [Pseudacidovorax sp. RU35E]|uniref:SGNH/GDSL hydrolase family protein n=1 Tax=Pseudacidovorax sp. RU35E TaxID=1907403 RepID=UPI0009550A3A|nr:SGNH/GDSL hydrolase family protein [Pseudacidovorax sp. RU35E]SIQ76855.1 Lysophospholipase L1 [Pseudacidovorax sp. RU35E]